MEARKITVVTSATQSKKVIMSSATTLRELKADLDANNISYNDMTFYEGTAKVELLSDDAVLPHDVPWKGSTTNELVFLLSNMNKKIESGATRAELYAQIKEANLASTIKEAFGKNYTQLSNEVLESFFSAPKSEATDCKTLLEQLSKRVEKLEEAIAEFKHNELSSSYSDDEINDMFNF